MFWLPCNGVFRIMFVWSASMALGGLLALSILPAAPRAYAHQHFKKDGWDLKIQHDGFAGRTYCQLKARGGKLLFQPGAIGFRLGRLETLKARYRVDNGSPIRWQDREPALIATGVAIDGPALDNPTGGWVWIPTEEVKSAHVVAIRADDHKPIRHFRMGGFADMLGTARRLGCSSDDTFRI
jgi:hypothetical protein